MQNNRTFLRQRQSLDPQKQGAAAVRTCPLRLLKASTCVARQVSKSARGMRTTATSRNKVPLTEEHEQSTTEAIGFCDPSFYHITAWLSELGIPYWPSAVQRPAKAR